jgi:NAD(P)-dependent dehydrogenase (short-subunit alcohol dehydrogenase family)
MPQIVVATSTGVVNLPETESSAGLVRRTLATAVEAAAQEAVDRFGRIDVLVNIAYAPDWPKRLSIMECEADLSNWRRCFDVNTFARMQITRQVAAHMIRQRAGRIVMINTMTAEKVQRGAYACAGSKAALQRMSRILAMELGPHGIRVNSIHPGFMLGPQNEEVMALRAQQNGTRSNTSGSLYAGKRRLATSLPRMNTPGLSCSLPPSCRMR